jgi:hypothetical protein
VAEIVKAIDFLGEEHAALSTALRYYQDKNGALGQTAPLDFLDVQEQLLVRSETGKLRVSLYKALLFLKVAEAVKAGIFNVRHYYKYRSLDDYLLPKAAWQREREEYVERAELTSAAYCATLLAALAQSLDTQFGETNRHILAGENPHLHFHKDGAFHVQTPKAEDEAGEALAGVFPERRYISLLEVLSTVNRLSHFVDDFHHWQVRRNHVKPPDRLFFAGILGYGCFIGTRKMARISKHINEGELENAVNWYFSLDNVQAANDRILRFMDQLELPELSAQAHQLRSPHPRRGHRERPAGPLRRGRARRGPADQEPRVEDGPGGARHSAIAELGTHRDADREPPGRPGEPVRVR